MKKLSMIMVCTLFPICVIAQQGTEYNRKGDEAMKRLDYRDARLFYGEGVPLCDMYSIDKLTTIWLANEQMRTSMHNLMNKCLNCISVKATENDTTAIAKLILYYSEGIGTPKNDELSSYWSDKLQEVKAMPDEMERYAAMVRGSTTKEPERRMKFFAGYSFSILSPVGLKVGGIIDQFGWYVNFRSNMSFQSFDAEFSGKQPNSTDYLEAIEQKNNSLAVTAGLIIKTTSNLYTSLGVGYGNRDVMQLYSKKNDSGIETDKIWYKVTDDSYNGVNAELDLILRYDWIYFSIGANTLNFKYIDLNAGVGVFF